MKVKQIEWEKNPNPKINEDKWFPRFSEIYYGSLAEQRIIKITQDHDKNNYHVHFDERAILSRLFVATKCDFSSDTLARCATQSALETFAKGLMETEGDKNCSS